MKLMQQDGGFRPIAIVLETEADAITFWDMVMRVEKCTDVEAEHDMAVKISNWFSNQAHL